MFYFISRTIFEIFIRLLFKLKIYGKKNIPKPPFIIASNHASLIDPPLVGITCPWYIVHFMAKRELFDAPVIGIWTRNVGCIEVRRGENSVRSLREAIRRLKKGQIVGIFPEGTRSVDGSLQEAQRGTGFLITKANVPVVPVYIEGSKEAFPKGKGVKRNTKVNVYIGKAISAQEFSSGIKGEKDYDAVSNMLMQRIGRAKEDIMAGKGAEVNIFDFALGFEKESENYYRELASKSNVAACKNIFEMLANDEKKHYNVLKHMKGNFRVEFQDTMILSAAKDALLKIVGQKDPFKPDMPQLDLYKKALDIEKKSQDFYLKRSEETESDVQKEIFKKIAEEEKKHFILINNVIEFISAPGTFLENAEFFQQDDYRMLRS